MDTREKVFAYIREHHMLQAGDRVVAGVSGGADSVCLLFLLLEWQKEVPTDIAVVHVDHGIRAEAGEDARYVEQLCEERGIPFFLTRAEVRNRARMEKISEEEAGRRTRYEAFEKAADGKATKIIIPAEIQGMAGLASALTGIVEGTGTPEKAKTGNRAIPAGAAAQNTADYSTQPAAGTAAPLHTQL